jgi:uncharacterized iron-regulated membrane protein
MSATARVAGKVHKWLALLMGIQILFWFVSGLFFAIAPIEQVRSEHIKSTSAPPPVSAQKAAAGLQKIGSVPDGEKIEIRSLMGSPVALISPHKGRPRLYDLKTGALISPISAPRAREIAEADYVGDLRATRVTLVTEESTEYRAALPAWRVDFDDEANRALYVAQDTATVTARRSTLWRIFDFLWSLHIMDFENHEDFNTPLLIGATALSLVMILAGIVLFPSRLGFNAWLRRRRRDRTSD